MPLDFSYTEFFAIVSVIILAVFATTFQPSFSEENRHECRIRVSTDPSLSPIERFSAMKQCYLNDESYTVKKKMNLEEYRAKLLDAYEKANKILTFCEQKYPIYLRTPEIQFHALLQFPWSTTCVKAYNSPYWNYTGTDRLVKIVNYVRNQTQQSLEETKEQRLLSVEEARIRQGQVMFLEDVFIKIENKIKNLELQIDEKNDQISKNESVIAEQQKTIDELSKKIKNTVLISTELEDIAKKTLDECLEIVKDKPLTFMEKYLELQECTRVDRHRQIVIDDETLTQISKKGLKGCTQNYPLFLELSIQDFYASGTSAGIRACPLLYNNPIWQYEGIDREQVLIDFIKIKIKEFIEEKGGERLKSVYDAHIRQGFLQVLPDIYIKVKQKIASLEAQIAEQNDQIEKQEATIQKQIKEIVMLTEKIKNTVLEQNSNLIIKI
jgi:uncharacterized coiled-coil protein SlyX